MLEGTVLERIKWPVQLDDDGQEEVIEAIRFQKASRFFFAAWISSTLRLSKYPLPVSS